MTTTTRTIWNIRRSFRYQSVSDWLGPALHEIENDHDQIVATARALLYEIAKRDGEGNIIPSHLTDALRRAIGPTP